MMYLRKITMARKPLLFNLLSVTVLLSTTCVQGAEYKYYTSREGAHVCKADGLIPYRGLLKKLFCTNEKAGIKCENDKFCPKNQKCLCHSMCEEFRCKVPPDIIPVEPTRNCTTLTCFNGGTCKVINGTETCHCNLDFKGPKCNIDAKTEYCGHPNPCKNNGICKSLADDYECNCTENFTGKNCDLKNNCRNCSKHADCVVENKTAECVCKTGFNGSNCNQNINECDVPQACGYNGRCEDTFGSFKCTCDAGFEGPRCEMQIDYCRNVTCFNGGKCTSEKTTSKCLCADGYHGNQCNQTSGGCSANSCNNRGRCSENKCICPSGFTGSVCETKLPCKKGFTGANCDMEINYCLGINCHNGSCKSNIGNYQCKCYSGYTGPHCEVDINECNNNPCFNNASCIDGKAQYACKCLDGYSGARCERKNCQSNYCQNGGTCYLVGFAEKCSCLDGFKGNQCEQRNYCPFKECHKESRLLSNNKQCIDKCNIPDCDFDHGFCSLGIQNPWSNCKSKICWRLFSNGVCNPECNNPDCLNDGNDCRTPKNCTQDAVCQKLFNNSKCDDSCNTAECGYDDCKAETVKVPGKLILTVFSTKTQFERRKSEFVRSMNIILNTHLTIRKVEEYFDNNSNNTLTTRRRRAAADLPKLKVTTSMRNQKGCTYCFTSASDAANYLAAQTGKKNLKLPVALYSVQGTKEDEPNEKIALSPLWIAIIVAVSSVFLLGVILGGKKVSSTLWFPQGHSRRPTNMQREPGVGQEGEECISLKRDSIDCESSEGESIPSAKKFKVNESSDWLPPIRGQIPRHAMSVTDSSDVCSIPSPLTFECRSTNICGGESNLHVAARLGKTELVSQLVSIGVDINERDGNGRTPLQAAVSALATSVFQILIRNRCHIDAQANDGCTALMDACRLLAYFMVDELVGTGAKPNLADNLGNTALHHAVRADNDKSAAFLLRNGAKVDAQNNKGETPLFIAARDGCFATAVVLLRNFANRNAADNMDVIPVTIAKMRGHKDVVNLLTGCGSTPSPIAMTQSPPPVSPKNYSEIRPKISSHAPQLNYQSTNKSAKRKRKAKDKKPLNSPEHSHPYQFTGIVRSPDKPSQLPVLDEDLLMQGLYNAHECFQDFKPTNNWHQQNITPSILTNTIDFTNVNFINAQGTQFQAPYLDNLENPFPTPPSMDMHSPGIELEAYQSPVFLTPSPESFATTSPDSGASVC